MMFCLSKQLTQDPLSNCTFTFNLGFDRSVKETWVGNCFSF